MVIAKAMQYTAVLNLQGTCGLERTDEELMIAAAGDDLEAYNLLYRKYRKPLYNFILRHTMDESASEDIFQETFLRLYRLRKTYKPTAKFSVFLYTIAYRLCINLAKKRNRWGFVKYLSDMVFKKEGEDTPTIEETIRSDDALPIDRLCEGELGEVLKNALTKLSENHRVTFILFEIHGFSYSEIAEITGINIGTVKSRLNAARKQLRDLLSNYLKDSPKPFPYNEEAQK